MPHWEGSRLSSPFNELRILIVADDVLARAGLAALVVDWPGCTVAGQTSGEGDLWDELEVYRPDLLLWDLGWEPTRALERLTDLQGFSAPMVVLLPGEAYAAEAWTAGARGILLRNVEVSSLLAALRAVAQGLAVLDPQLAATALLARDRSPTPLVGQLTPRELEVLRLLAEGLPNKSIAQRLGISEHTVKFHVNAILTKLDAQSRTEAVSRATRLGLIPL